MNVNQRPRWRLGVVSYLNARPLIAGLEVDPRLELVYEVPAHLAGMLDRGVVNAGLVPVIDLFHEERTWQIVSDACIGSDGETLTVRVFSTVPAESIRTLHVDTDSHTSVALAEILWKECYGRKLEVLPLCGDASPARVDALLLIGDKVVANRPIGYEFETDLGSAWRSLTSLPFVFAVWASPRDLDVRELAVKLSDSRDRGVAAAELIADDVSAEMGWPASLARSYLTGHIGYTLGPREKEGLITFAELASKHGLISPLQEPVFA